MTGLYLQRMVENLPDGCLPSSWGDFDLATFSRGKRLWEYQQDALRNALLAIWKYYSGDPGGGLQDAAALKHAYLAWYQDFGLETNLDLALDRSSAAKRKLANLLATYYTPGEDDRLPYEQFINRMSFWMATGSGKTLVIVKLIEILRTLIERGEIPAHNILVLTHRDDLLEQLRRLVDEYNAEGGLFIRLRELREYAEAQRENPTLLSGQEITVFYYRSDNLSDEQKEKIIDFRSYDNHGNWYVLLDEAHKGDKEDSKRQHIYSILSRNGFLFNFSATFVDVRDIVTTVANFNLSEFIRKGHGKHLRVLNQEVRGFRKEEEFTDLEKQKIVLKALIMLAYTRQFEAQVRQARADLYHRPLMMTLVNSVNTEDADLKLFFRELVRIGNGKIDPATWEEAKADLLSELRGSSDFLFENGVRVKVNVDVLRGLSQADLIRDVFNATSAGEIEVLVRPSNRQEVAFKLKTSDDPFALVRIGDISDWLKQELSGYEVNQHFTDEGYFESLNHPDSDINILLGSRSFYEGWDSNRPNVIMYVNIGTATDAKKFILQSVGRGVRIEPLKDRRKRLRELSASGALTPDEQTIFEQIKDQVQPLESVFIFGTNREALNLVISELDQEERQSGEVEIALEVNHEDVDGKLLLIPTYQQRDIPLASERDLAKFALTEENLATLQGYLDYVNDDRVFFALHGTAPRQIATLRASLKNPDETYRTDSARPYRNLSVLVRQSTNFFAIRGKKFSGFKPLEEEINHFRHIKVTLEEIGGLERRIRQVIASVQAVQEAKAQYAAGQLSLDDLLTESARQNQGETFFAENALLEIRRVANHYYIPVLLSENERIDYIRTVIHVASEVHFMRQLEDYVRQKDNGFRAYDWWLFSRVEEKLDDITIPYYYPVENRMANFKPDFIFWLRKGNRYKILFVDPKGTGRSEYEHKVDGYRLLFEENSQPKIFHHQGLDVSVHLFLYTADRQLLADGYRRFWYDDVGKMMEAVG
ncbi:MAG TPA: DEAD/DEAH box helicase family protein [Anaerolineaceae bacterium]|nr:DEAD/DEAH box helicase family protein [Anaerolineaceae bacterium]